jgi:hypothetical protein
VLVQPRQITYSISGVFPFSLSTAWIKIMQGEEKTSGFFFTFLLFESGQGERLSHASK